MEIRICPDCKTHNTSSAWYCRKCGQTLSMDTLIDLDDELVNLSEPSVVNGEKPKSKGMQSLLDTPSMNDLKREARQKKEAQIESVAAEEREKQHKELVLAAIRWNSWDDGFGTQARIVRDFQLAGSHGIEVLLELLMDEKFTLKENVIAIMNELKSPEAVEPLVDIYSTAESDLKKVILGILIHTIRGHGGGLGNLYSPSKPNPVWPRSRKLLVIETFIRAYKDDDHSVRSIAASGIMQNMENWIRFEYDFSLLIDSLISNLDNESEGMRKAAAQSLGHSKERRAIDALKEALEDEKGSVRKAAKKAIKRLEKDLNLS
jgi:hypothetical protein